MNDSTISGTNISELIKIILIKKNLNIAKLAEIMGVSGTTMYSKFKRNNFSFKDLDKISEVLNLSYEVSFTINETYPDEKAE